MLVGLLLELLSIGILLPLVTLISSPDFFYSLPFSDNLVTIVGEKSNENIVIFFLILVLIIYFFKFLMLILITYLRNNFTFKLRENIASKLFKKYTYQTWSFHVNTNTSKIIYNITTEVSFFSNSVILPLLVLLTEILIIIGISVMLLVVDFAGALMIITVLALVAVIIFFIFKKINLELGKKRQKHENLRIKFINETFNLIKDVKLFNKETYFFNKYFREEKISTNVSQNQATIKEIPRLVIELVAVFCFAIFIIFSLYRGYDLSSIIPILTVFAASAFRLMPSVNRIIGSLQTIQHGLPSINVIYREIYNDENSSLPANSKISPIKFKNDLTINKLSFRYPTSNNNILNNLNLKIQVGDKIGIKGQSGAGKSTLSNIILGLLNPSKGFIELDNRPLDKSQLRSWHKIIGYVPQNIVLLDDSIRNNIAFGIEEKEICEKKLNQAIELSNLSDFIDFLPDGAETVVGERGARISGGQLQRIGIARALYHRPQILILDEATSALDVETELDLLNEIYTLNKEMTIVMISHKDISLGKSEYIYELKNGKLELL